MNNPAKPGRLGAGPWDPEEIVESPGGTGLQGSGRASMASQWMER